ncbi:MAG: ROK family protein [Lachnospiraceae bacterium]|jgi:predicted NBD/HSP70 family sugar kinase|nr:ROK family protein [Lachnospiraceae bacterium]
MYLVFDVGGTFIKYALMDGDGEIVEKNKVKTPPNKPGTNSGDFVETLGRIFDECVKKEKLDGIAIALPGQIDVDNGIVYGGGALPYLHEARLQELLEKRCDGTPVALQNDAKAAALAEVWKGNASDVDDACIMIFGTGIGGAIIKDRKVHIGKHLLAGELSFAIMGLGFEDVDKIRPVEGLGVLESYDKVPYISSAHGSTAMLCHKYAVRKGLLDDDVTGELIYKNASEGDEVAQGVLNEMYFAIAKQCLNLYVIYDPEVILIGGGISAEPKFIEGIREYVDKIKKISRVYESIKLDVCKFRNDSNLLGALYNFKQKYEIAV